MFRQTTSSQSRGSYIHIDPTSTYQNKNTLIKHRDYRFSSNG